MTTLSSDAQQRLDRYLKQIRIALRPHPSVDAGEVERDVLGHIDAELAEQPQPISASSLDAVLERLGAPEAWVPSGGAMPRTAFNQWLAYVCLGLTPLLFAAGVIMFLGGPVFWPLEPVMVIASVLLARASLELLSDQDEPVGARRWLIYPPLLLMYAAAAVVLLVWPVAPVLIAMEQLLPAPSWTMASSTGALALGVWWVILSLIAARFPLALSAAFRPFADEFNRRHAKRLLAMGLGLIVLAGAIITLAMARGSAVSILTRL